MRTAAPGVTWCEGPQIRGAPLPGPHGGLQGLGHFLWFQLICASTPLYWLKITVKPQTPTDSLSCPPSLL